MFTDVLDAPVDQLGVDSLRLLRLEDGEQVQGILELYNDTNVVREHIAIFTQHLLDRTDSWFVEVVDTGLIYLTNILPGWKADFNVIFWDMRFGADRRELCKRVIATAFEEFELERVQAFVPASNKPLAEVAMKKIGFTLEGVMRKAWKDKSLQDLYAFSMLKEESKAESVASLKVKV